MSTQSTGPDTRPTTPATEAHQHHWWCQTCELTLAEAEAASPAALDYETGWRDGWNDANRAASPAALDAPDPIAQAKFALHRLARTTEDAQYVNGIIDALAARLTAEQEQTDA